MALCSCLPSNRRLGAPVRYLNEAVAASMIRTVPEVILRETILIVEQCYRDIEIERKSFESSLARVDEKGEDLAEDGEEVGGEAALQALCGGLEGGGAVGLRGGPA